MFIEGMQISHGSMRSGPLALLAPQATSDDGAGSTTTAVKPGCQATRGGPCQHPHRCAQPRQELRASCRCEHPRLGLLWQAAARASATGPPASEVVTALRCCPSCTTSRLSHITCAGMRGQGPAAQHQTDAQLHAGTHGQHKCLSRHPALAVPAAWVHEVRLPKQAHGPV